VTPEFPLPAENPPPAEAVVKAPGRGRWLALGTAAVLSAVVVGGGVGYGVLQVVDKPKHQAAASHKPAPVKAPTYGALSNGNHFGSLSDLLMPVPNEMKAGPDDAGFGNDAVLTASQYKTFYEKTISYLSTADRKRQEQDFQASFVKGYAVRTYLVSDTTDIEIALRQENQGAAKGDSR